MFAQCAAIGRLVVARFDHHAAQAVLGDCFFDLGDKLIHRLTEVECGETDHPAVKPLGQVGQHLVRHVDGNIPLTNGWYHDVRRGAPSRSDDQIDARRVHLLLQ